MDDAVLADNLLLFGRVLARGRDSTCITAACSTPFARSNGSASPARGRARDARARCSSTGTTTSRDSTRVFDAFFRAHDVSSTTPSCLARRAAAVEARPRRDAPPSDGPSTALTATATAAERDDRRLQRVAVSRERKDFADFTPAELEAARRAADASCPGGLATRTTRRWQRRARHGHRSASRAAAGADARRADRAAVPTPASRRRGRSSSSATSADRWSATAGCSCTSSKDSSQQRTAGRELRLRDDADPHHAVAVAAAERARSCRASIRDITDWGGGTRIGEVAAHLQHRLGAARDAPRSGRPARVRRMGSRRSGDARARSWRALRRSCRRLIWLNPLARVGQLRAADARHAGGAAATSTTSCRCTTSPASSSCRSTLQQLPESRAASRPRFARQPQPR